MTGSTQPKSKSRQTKAGKIEEGVIGMSVWVSRDVWEKAKRIAAHRNQQIGEVITQICLEPLDREYRQVVKEMAAALED